MKIGTHSKTNEEPPGLLAADHIDVAYGAGPNATALLSDLSIKITPGELVAVVGPNGSGKSTLVRSLSRTLKPRRGIALLDDDNLYTQVDARRAAKAIGVVPQETHVAFDFTVREVVAMGRAPHQNRLSLLSGETRADRRAVDQALARAGIGTGLAARPISAVSGGERQRALIARALAQEARILLLDEPTASLDLAHQTALLEWLRELCHTESRAVLVVLHDLNLAAAYADRVIVLSRGRIAAQGTPVEALTAQTIQEVWGANVWVRCHPASGRPYILNMPELFGAGDRRESGEAPPLAGKRIHILCGGGTGASLMATLSGLGARLTAGALGQGDTDEEVATLLAVPHPMIPPFSPVTDEADLKARESARDCELVVLTEVPFGEGNVATLLSALEMAREGRRVIAVQQEGGALAESRDHLLAESRDHTKGHRATKLWQELLSLPTVQVVGDPAAAIVAEIESEA